MKNVLLIFVALSILSASSQDSSLEGRVAFFGYNGDNKSVYVINGNGSNILQVTNDSASVADFTISPDGLKLAVTIDGDLYMINIFDGIPKRLTFNRSIYLPKWSPNGKSIAFTDRFDEYAELCVIDTSGLAYQRLVPFHSKTGNISSTWSPDSKEIAFQGDGYNFFIVNIDQPSKIRQITATLDDKKRRVIRKFPSWSPNGKKIAFYRTSKEDVSNKEGIYTMNPDGSEPTLILELQGSTITDWTPDSKYIVCELFRDGRFDICVINLQGEIIRNLTKDTNDRNYMPSWSLR